jgi:hypothetical protein
MLLCTAELELALHECSTPPMHHAPASHAEHTSPSAPLKPGTQVQSVILLAPAVVLLLAGQLFLTPPKHHDPASHSIHSPSWAPYHPVLQVQATDELLPVGDSELMGQVATEFPPTQKELAAHLVHAPPSAP